MSKWIGLGAFVVLAGLVAGGIWWQASQRSGNPRRVLVALRGSAEPSADRLLLERFSDAIGAVGFEVVEGPPGLAPGALGIEPALDAAAAADAGYAVLLDLTMTRVRDGLEPDTSLYDAALTATLLPTSMAPDAPTQSRTIAFAFEQSSEAEMVDFCLGAWASALPADVVGWIYADPTFDREIVHGVPSSPEEASLTNRLREHETTARERNERAAELAGFCETERRSLTSPSSADVEAGVTCTGNPCGQWTLIGVDAAGRALVQDMTREPYFTMANGRVAWTEPPERILAVPLASDAPAVELHHGGHYYGFGRASDDGRFVAVAPFGMSNLALITLPTDGTEATVAARLGPRERAGTVRPHPDGAGLLAILDDAHWYYFHDGTLTPIPEVSNAAWASGPDGATIVGMTESAWLVIAPDGSLVRTVPMSGEDLGTPELVDTRGTEVWAQIHGRYGCSLSRFDAVSGLETHVGLPTCIGSPASLPDGRIAGIVRMLGGSPHPDGTNEVVVVDPDRQSVVAVTRGPAEEDVVHVTSGDAPRLVFNRRLGDWPVAFDLGIYRRVVCWADVPPR